MRKDVDRMDKIFTRPGKKYFAAAVLCGLLLGICGAAAAAAENEPEEIIIRAAITGHESGQIYKVTDDTGAVLRADLGKHGGRMLNHHPFLLTATVEEDEQGQLLKMRRVEYEDPVVQIEKAPAQTAKETEENLKIESERDAAYSHDLSKSHNKHFYQYNMADVSDFSGYKRVAVADISKEAAGAKVAFTGSAVATVTKGEVMRFWGGAKDNSQVQVKMNGAYVPLGQRSTVYGILQEDGSVLLEYLESIA